MSSETKKKKAYLIYLKWNSFVERLETFKHKFGEKTTDKNLKNEKTKLTQLQKPKDKFLQNNSVQLFLINRHVTYLKKNS